MVSQENLLKISALTGVRGYSVLFSGLDFILPAGQFVALRGPNGSGKTTLLRLIAGLISPETGRITISASPQTDTSDPNDQIFYLGHEHGLRANETPLSHLHDWADIHRAPSHTVKPALDRVGLTARSMVSAYALSAGQKKRLGLARALVAPRRIWLLDEPAAALDAAGQSLLCDLIGEHCAKGGAVLAALHDTLDIEPDTALNMSEFQP